MGAILQDWINRTIWNFSPERAVNLENPKQTISGWSIDEVLGGNTSTSGQSISYDNALTISAVWRASSIRSGLISSLPFKVYRKTDSGRVEVKPSEHPVAKLFARKPNAIMTKPVFFDRGVNHFDFWGNHYGLIKKNGLGIITEIELLHPKDVEVFKNNGKVTYKYKENPISSDDIIHVPNLGDDVCGKSVIGKAREDLAMQMDTRQYGVNFYAKGGRPSGILTPEHKIIDTQREQIKKAWDEGKKRGGDAVLPFGLKYQAISVPPDDAAFLATNQFGITTIARWFGVPPQKLAELGRATFNNVEALAIEFIQDTIWPIVTKFEAEYTTKLFTAKGEEDFYLEFNLDAYQRADSTAKADLYSTYIQNGIKTPNEIRRLNNDPDDPYGNDLMIQSATVPIKMSGQNAGKNSANNQKSKRRNRRYSIDEIERIIGQNLDSTQIELFQNGNGNGKH